MTGAVTAVQVGSSPRCRSCGAPIFFGRTAKGRRMPLDPAPVEDGNVIVDQDMRLLDKLASAYVGDSPPPEGAPVRVLHKFELIDPDVPRYRTHFASCPAADRHRRAKAKVRASATPADAGGPPPPVSAGVGGAQGQSLGEVAMVQAPPTSTGGPDA